MEAQRKTTIRKRLGRSNTTPIWNDNIKIDLIRTACKVAAWIHTILEEVRWLFFNRATGIPVL